MQVAACPVTPDPLVHLAVPANLVARVFPVRLVSPAARHQFAKKNKSHHANRVRRDHQEMLDHPERTVTTNIVYRP
jgi:hypothetical protein